MFNSIWIPYDTKYLNDVQPIWIPYDTKYLNDVQLDMNIIRCEVFEWCSTRYEYHTIRSIWMMFNHTKYLNDVQLDMNTIRYEVFEWCSTRYEYHTIRSIWMMFNSIWIPYDTKYLNDVQLDMNTIRYEVFEWCSTRYKYHTKYGTMIQLMFWDYWTTLIKTYMNGLGNGNQPPLFPPLKGNKPLSSQGP